MEFLERLAVALREEGDRRRSDEEGGFGIYGEGLSREERDQWYSAAEFVLGWKSECEHEWDERGYPHFPRCVKCGALPPFDAGPLVVPDEVE